MTRLFTYIVARDYGFAPNPFHAVCTLATCKPNIRAAANIGDVVMGKASTLQNRNPEGRIVYLMRVSETLTFDEYWRDPRFAAKQPKLNGSRKQRYGDNIYHHNHDDAWVQADSHHSWENGVVNEAHLKNDTKVDRILLGAEFTYWGSQPRAIPPALIPIIGRAGVREKRHFNDDELAIALEWLEPLLGAGLQGRPASWP